MKKYFRLIFVNPLKRAVNTARTMSLALLYFLTRHTESHIYGGIPLKIFINDRNSKLWYDHNLFRDEIKFLQQNGLKEGARVFDIGAHQCVIALILSKIVGSSGAVLGVEMSPYDTEMAEINKRNNKAQNLHIVNAAVGEKNGYALIRGHRVLQSTSRLLAEEVRLVTIDELATQFFLPSLLYIDVEGYECKVLEGAKNTMQHYPDCCIEVHVKAGLEENGGSVEKLVSYFPKEKYTLYMAPPCGQCTFIPFNTNSEMTKKRFYLTALHKKNT